VCFPASRSVEPERTATYPQHSVIVRPPNEGSRMAEAQVTMMVCDICGMPADGTITYKVNSASKQNDLCREHLMLLVDSARAPRRGRRPRNVVEAGATTAQPRRRGRPKGSTTKSTATRKARGKAPAKRATR